MRAWLILVALAAPARAETILGETSAAGEAELPTLRIGHPGAQVVIERATLAMRIEERAIAATLTLALTATYSARDAPVELEVPGGTRVTGLAVKVGKQARLVARPLAAEAAREDYRAVVEGVRDPGLLQWVGSTGERDRLELRVFPLGETSPATVELAFVLPRVTALAIDPDGQLIRRLDVAVGGAARRSWTELRDAQVIALARTAVPLAPGPSLVTATSSLFAGERPPRVTITIGEPHGGCQFGGRPIRRVVRDHHAQLRYCYERVLQANPYLAGTAQLVFAIEPDGRVSAARVGGELDHPEVAACIEREARSWRFAPDTTRTEVRYPLHFRSSSGEPREPE